MASSPAQTTCLTPQHLDGWHFPYGNSSKYHRSERSRPAYHTRYKSSYTPTAPVLSTELRAHRRTRSSITVATASSPTPRVALMSSTGPHTPERRRRKSIEPHGSPFSDYFTDENRSRAASSFQIPSAATQQLLVRLSRLQAQLIREDTPNLFHIVEHKMNEIDTEVKAAEEGSAMRDSGLFIEEEDFDRTELPCEEVVEPVVVADVLNDGEADVDAEDPAGEEEGLDQSLVLAEARQVLETVTQAQQELRQRLEEMSQLRLSLDKDEDEDDEEVAEAEATEDEQDEDRAESPELSEDVYGQFDEERSEGPNAPKTEIEDLGEVFDRPKSSHSDADLDARTSAWRELWQGLYDLAGMSSLDP